MRLLPLIIALKKAILSLKSKTYTSNFKNSFMTCTSYQILSTISSLINFPILSSNAYASNFSSVSNLNLSHMLSETSKLNYLRTFIGDLSVRNLYNGFNVICNKSFFSGFNSIKSLGAINLNLINSTLKKLYINNLAKSNLLFNNNLKSRGVFVNSSHINKNKSNIRGFKQLLFTFLSKSNYYDKKKLAFKLSAYRR
jgi:hypothetical protein